MDLLTSNIKDSILVVIGHFTKMAHFIPCNKIIISEVIAKLLFENIYQIYRLANNIIFNCRS